MDSAKLNGLSSVRIGDYPKESLVDIKEIHVDGGMEASERILRYIDDVKNPYLFRVGDTVVKVCYGETATLQESIINAMSPH